MSINYEDYCMKFSNKELNDYLISKIKNKNTKNIRILTEDGEEIDINSEIPIETIVFDGYDENLFINFFEIQTSIFIFDKEIMFIDENSKGTYTSSDTYNNAVYEGKLREQNRLEILQMFFEIIYCFISATDVQMLFEDVPEEKKYKKYNYYTPYMCTINVENDNTTKKSKIFENITINY